MTGAGYPHTLLAKKLGGGPATEKPHPQIFEIAIEQAGDDDVWMIGDNAEADCHGAVAAGLRAVLVRRTDQTFEPAVAGAVEAVAHVLATR